jgi:hypothetical protein
MSFVDFESHSSIQVFRLNPRIGSKNRFRHAGCVLVAWWAGTTTLFIFGS